MTRFAKIKFENHLNHTPTHHTALALVSDFTVQL